LRPALERPPRAPEDFFADDFLAELFCDADFFAEDFFAAERPPLELLADFFADAFFPAALPLDDALPVIRFEDPRPLDVPVRPVLLAETPRPLPDLADDFFVEDFAPALEPDLDPDLEFAFDPERLDPPRELLAFSG
jgi:hypothetical protein